MGLVEVLVSVALMAVAVSALMGTSGTILVGANTAERRTVEQRLQGIGLCSLDGSEQLKVDSSTYTVKWTTDCSNQRYAEYKVTVTDPSGSYSLSADRVMP